MSTTPTPITVRVIARDGKFLGDDIGGAHITVRDALTRAILAEGRTSGGSGNNDSPTTQGVMCVALKRGQPLPTANASAFNVSLNLSGPRRIEVTAFGPIGALGSANTVSATQWVYPGKALTEGNGFLLELPGLIVQIVNPVTHFAPPKPPAGLTLQANVAMMCGCPISVKPQNAICTAPAPDQPWDPAEFEVAASVLYIAPNLATQSFGPLAMNIQPSLGTAGQFTGSFTVPGIGQLPAGSYQITVYAYQAATGNTGVDMATVFVAA